MSFLQWLVLQIKQMGEQYCTSSDSNSTRHWGQYDLPRLLGVGHLKAMIYLECMQITRCSNLHDQSLFTHLFSELTTNSLIASVNANTVAHSELQEMNLCNCLTMGMLALAWSLWLPGRSKMVASLHADAFPVCFKSYLTKAQMELCYQ